MTKKDRLEKYLQHKGIGPTAFARALGISNSHVSEINSRRNNRTLYLAIRSNPDFSDCNTEWIDTGEGEMLQNKFKQFADARLRQMAEKRAAGNVVAEAQARYPTGSLALTAFEETLFYMLRDLPEEARKRVEKDIIMEWTAARRQKPT